jgi:GntR family transcriptional repressor for pyruvate dehydrogenase complex
MSSHTRIKPQKTAMLIARRIVGDIRRGGGFTIGNRLPSEKKMLETYQIGRGTLREALRFLELQGVISLKPGPGGGPTVERPDASHLATSLVLLLEFADAPFSTVVQARVDLEPILARLASERMTDEHMGKLITSVDEMRSNLNDKDVFLQTNKDFHGLIAWTSGNSLYGYLIDTLIEIVDGTSLGVDYPVKRRGAILEAHSRILNALLAHDGDSSQESMAQHMGEYERYLQKRYHDVLSEPITWDML